MGACMGKKGTCKRDSFQFQLVPPTFGSVCEALSALYAVDGRAIKCKPRSCATNARNGAAIGMQEAAWSYFLKRERRAKFENSKRGRFRGPVQLPPALPKLFRMQDASRSGWHYFRRAIHLQRLQKSLQTRKRRGQPALAQ